MKLPVIAAVLIVSLRLGLAEVKSGLPDGHTPLVLTPGTPEGSYLLNSFESINIYNGKLNIAVPLLTASGRGSSGYSLTAALESISWSVQVDTTLQSCGETCISYAHTARAVWSEGATLYRAWYGPGILLAKRSASTLLSCTGTTIMGSTFTHLVFLEPDATERALFPANGSPVQINNCSGPGNSPRGTEFVSWDEAGLMFRSSTTSLEDVTESSYYDSGAKYNPLDANGTLFFPDGTRYIIQGGLVQQIVDRNGNKTTFQYAVRNGGGPSLGTVFVSQITDSAGRKYFIDYLVANEPGCGEVVQCDRIQYSGEGGSTRKIIIRRQKLRDRLRSDFALGPLFPNLVSEQSVADEFLLSEINLPNGASWSFYYNPYGEVAKVVLPSGGAIEYDHGAGLSNAGAPGTYASGQVLDDLVVIPSFSQANPPWRPVIYRRLLQRREYNSAISNETNAKRSETPFKTSIYNRFETASDPYTHPEAGRIADVTITSGGTISVEHSGLNATTVVENHKFHDGMNPYVNGSLASVSPAQTIKFGANGSSDWLESYPDPYQGKEYHTSTSGLRTTERGVWARTEWPGCAVVPGERYGL